MASYLLTAAAADAIPTAAIPRRWIIAGCLAIAGAVFIVALKQPIALLILPIVIPALYAAVAYPSVYTLLALGLLYSNVPAIAVRFYGLPMIVGMALVPALLAVPIAHQWLFRRRAIAIDPVFQLAVLFFLTQLFATLFSAKPAVSLQKVWQMGSEGLLLYLLVFNAVRSAAVLRQIVWVLILCGGAVGAICLFQYATKTYDNNYGGFARMDESRGFFTTDTDLQGQVLQPRLGGPIGAQNYFAQCWLMLVPLGLFRYWDERKAGLRVAALIATALVMLGIMLAFSRGAAFGFVVMFALMTVLRYVTVRQSLVVVAAVGVLLLVLPQFLTRLASLTVLVSTESKLDDADSSSRSRTVEALAGIYMFADHPWTGVGPEMYPFRHQHYARIIGTEVAGVMIQEELRHPHVLYLGVAAETGLPGLIALLWMVGVALSRLEAARRASLQAGRPDLAHLVAGFLFAIVCYLSTGLFLHFACIRYFWLMMALAGAASVIVIKELSRAPSRATSTPQKT